MTEIGVRALKQNASAVVAHVVAGEVVTITRRGLPVATMTGITKSRLDVLIASGQARPAHGDIAELPEPPQGPSLSAELEAMRASERY